MTDDDIDDELNIFLKDKSKCHIYIKQRTSRKYITIIELYDGINRKKLLGFLKKNINCGGYIETESICLNGDYRLKSKELLVNCKLFTQSDVIIHGF